MGWNWSRSLRIWLWQHGIRLIIIMIYDQWYNQVVSVAAKVDIEESMPRIARRAMMGQVHTSNLMSVGNRHLRTFQIFIKMIFLTFLFKFHGDKLFLYLKLLSAAFLASVSHPQWPFDFRVDPLFGRPMESKNNYTHVNTFSGEASFKEEVMLTKTSSVRREAF